METVGSALLHTLLLPVAIALCVSLCLWLLPVITSRVRQWAWQRERLGQTGARHTIVDRVIALAEKKHGTRSGDTAPNAAAASGPASIVAETDHHSTGLERAVHFIERATGDARSVFSHFPTSLIIPGVVVVAAIFSAYVGAMVLYVPLVSRSYRSLYEAYCRADAVGGIVANRPGSAAFAASRPQDACQKAVVSVPTKDQGKGALSKGGMASEDEAQRTLSQEEVFYLLRELGLLDPRERTVAQLFAADQITPNRWLASLLQDKAIYEAGTPTAALLVRLASALGSGKDVVGREGGKSTADCARARVAGIAVVMAQQPYLHNGAERTIGHALLADGHTRTISELLGPGNKGASGAAEPGGTIECGGDAMLTVHRLGSGFVAAGPGWIGPPLVSRPTDRLSDGEIVSIALDWSRFDPKDALKKLPSPPAEGADLDGQREVQAVIDFMRNITSETSAVPKVREGRVAVNFFIGWERLAILVVSTFLVLCLLWQQAMRINDDRHLRLIRDVIAAAPRPELLSDALSILRGSLTTATTKTINRSAPLEILDAAMEAVRLAGQPNGVDRDRLRRAAEHEMRILDRNRFFFLAGLPLLPTIGFIGTVHSLIEALAIADNIPRARDAVAQVAAVSQVTATLSLCFSTTFMALTALLIFAPLDLWQSARERRVVEETERLLDDKLLPRV